MIALGQVTGELQDVKEWTAQIGATAPTISSTKARTGSYALAFTAVSASVGHAFAAQSGVRVAAWLNHNNPVGSFTAYIFRLRNNTTEIVRLQLVGNGNLQLLVNNSVVAQASPAAAGISATNIWLHVGLCYVASGTVTAYVNGLAVLTGTAPATQINEAYIGGASWGTTTYFDDFYIDGDISVDEAPPPDRFLFSRANGAGSSSEWTPMGAATNYECVDDAVPNNDTDYVIANAAELVDLYATTNLTLPTDYKVSLVRPVALARAMTAGPTIKLVASDGTNTTTGDAVMMGTSYAYYYDTLELAPDGGEWTEAKINAAQFGYKSAGTFS